MAARPPYGLVAALALALVPAGCGGGGGQAHDSAAAQRQRLVRSAEVALRRYNARAARPRMFTGPGVRLRVSPARRVSFTIRFSCSGHPLRAFADRPPRLSRGGSFSYGERGRGYRLGVRGQVGAATARGRVSVVTRGCRTRARWRAASA